MSQQTVKNEMLNVRVDPSAKANAAQILANFGLNLSDAVRMLIMRINAEGKLPTGLFMNEADYDAWFTAKVREALDDPGPYSSHKEVMDEAQAIIDRKRHA